MPQGGQIALYHLPEPVSQRPPVIVTHGSISNADTVMQLAQFLHCSGYDCWVLEWGGHGHSEIGLRRQNFEFPALNDVPVALDYVSQQTNAEQCYWVSHSGGGHLMLMYLARNPKEQNRVAGIVTMGAQATHAAITPKDKLRASLLWLLTSVLGETPARLVPYGNEHEPTLLLAQWSEWNLKQRWVGHDNFDYMNALGHINVPALVFSGGGDDIAPITGCHSFYQALGSDEKSWVLLSKEHGFSKDYSHGQLVRGSAAQQEVYPKIFTWLQQLPHG